MKNDKPSYDEKLEKFLSLKSRGYIAELKDLKGPDPREKYEEDGDEDDEILDYIEPGSEREKEGLDFANKVLRGMYAAFAAVSLLFLAVGLILIKDRLCFAAGIVTGIVTGIYYIHSLNLSVRETLRFNENTAEKTMKKDARIRLVVVGIGAIVACTVAGGSAVYGILAEIFALKLSSYLAPLFLAISNKKNANKN